MAHWRELVLMPPVRPQFSGLTKSTPIDSPRESNSPNANDNPFDDDDEEDEEIDLDTLEVDTSDLTDRSVKILPGVRRMIDSIPEGRYAVATSGATTYCYGALSRVGITPPKVTITADDPRLKRGKPFPDRELPLSHACVRSASCASLTICPLSTHSVHPGCRAARLRPEELPCRRGQPERDQGWCRIRRQGHCRMHITSGREDQQLRHVVHCSRPRVRDHQGPAGRPPQDHH